MPRGIIGRLNPYKDSTPGLLSRFNLAEIKLYLVLADACKYGGEVRTSNAQLMMATGLDDKSLRRARRSLDETFRVISAKPADGRRESYVYTVFNSASSAKPEPVGVDAAIMPEAEIEIVPVSYEALHSVLNVPPSLEGKPAKQPDPTKPLVNLEYLPKVRKRAEVIKVGS